MFFMAASVDGTQTYREMLTCKLEKVNHVRSRSLKHNAAGRGVRLTDPI